MSYARVDPGTSLIRSSGGKRSPGRRAIHLGCHYTTSSGERLCSDRNRKRTQHRFPRFDGRRSFRRCDRRRGSRFLCRPIYGSPHRLGCRGLECLQRGEMKFGDAVECRRGPIGGPHDSRSDKPRDTTEILRRNHRRMVLRVRPFELAHVPRRRFNTTSYAPAMVSSSRSSALL